MRLYIMVEPLLFFSIRLAIGWWLITNKMLCISYIISAILLISIYIMIFQTNDMKQFKKDLNTINTYKWKWWFDPNDEIKKPIKVIKPNYKNALIILCWIVRDYIIEQKECTKFYVTYKDPYTNLGANYLYYKSKYEENNKDETLGPGFTVSHLKRYYPKITGNNIKIENYKKKTNYIFILFIIVIIIAYIIK